MMCRLTLIDKNSIARIIGLWFLIVLVSCNNSKDKDKEDPSSKFDRTTLLTQAADQIIIPAYKQFQQKASSLKIAVDTFANNPTATNLSSAQQKWVEAALAWQSCNGFNFGPAKAFDFGDLFNNIGTFPASVSKIEGYVTSGNSSLNNFDRDSRGIYGLEYLMFNTSNDASAILALYTSDSKATSRKQYIQAVANDVVSNIDKVVTQWGSYRSGFVSDNETSSTSAITLYYNSFLVSYEDIKNYKLGIPAGKRAGQSGVAPDQVEAYYTGRSLELIKEHFAAIKRMWYGTGLNNQAGVGFEEYIRSVEGGDALADATSARFNEMESKINELSNQKLSDLVSSNNAKVTELYDLFTNSTHYIKSDLSSLLGLTITYSSGDGD